jgi:heparosan-N-sulfate-glucuronate 5-epimerase
VPLAATGDRRISRTEAIRNRLRFDVGSPDTFSSERSFDPPIGSHWQPGDAVRGYYIDFSFKAHDPEWPPSWMGPIGSQLHVRTAQWGLAAYERYLHGHGEEWLRAARAAAEHMVEHQHRGGPQDGGWLQLFSYPHTFRLDPPWLAAMAQGEGASLLVRLNAETGEERFAEAALRALKPMAVPVADGGTLATLGGGPFLEEYPTTPSSYVLNGGIFAMWGYHDVGKGLGENSAAEQFQTLATTLAENLWRYDTGYWSRYDLYPHPIPHLASPAYHLLHIKQLKVLDALCPQPEFGRAIERFEAYRQSRGDRARALRRKVAFRLMVPRNPILSRRLPWNDPARAHRRVAAG